MRMQRRRFLCLRGAAVALQAAWRGWRARAQLQRAAAAAQIQRYAGMRPLCKAQCWRLKRPRS